MVKSVYEAAGLTCPSCGKIAWDSTEDLMTCSACGSEYPLDEGVLRMDGDASGDEISRYYSVLDGTHFVGALFETNPLVYIMNRGYQRFLDSLALKPSSILLDFGCGDGRLSLWAAERGFQLVVAIDRNPASLKRLAAEAKKRELKNLVIVCANATNPPFKSGTFDAVLCFEVLYYLVPALGRTGAIGLPARLLKPDGMMVVGELSRLGRALIDIDAMNLENARSLLQTSMRFEKFADSRISVFQWSVAELRADVTEAGFKVVRETGISPVAALFNYAWSFTSYPLRPRLDSALRELIEALSDQTEGAYETARNVVFALERQAN